MMVNHSNRNKILVVFVLLVASLGCFGLFISSHRSESKAVTRHYPELNVPLETVSGRISAKNGFAWKYRYRIGLVGGCVVVKVAVTLIPADGVSRVRLNRAKTLWEDAIERVWSRKFGIKTPEGRVYPIVIDVSFKGGRFDYEVVVRPGTGKTDQLNWGLMDPPELIAHEFGHMIGEYDEYGSGGLSPDSPIIDGTSIMWRYPGEKSIAFKRHYRRFLKWFVKETGSTGAILVSLGQDAPKVAVAHMHLSRTVK